MNVAEVELVSSTEKGRVSGSDNAILANPGRERWLLRP